MPADTPLTQPALDALLAQLRAAWGTLPTDIAGVWWVATVEIGDPLGRATAQESLGLDAEGHLHWVWRQLGHFSGDATLPATVEAQTLCRLPETWPRFVARLRRWRGEHEETRDARLP